MFLNHVGKPTKIKKIIYLITSTVLGLFLSIIAHSLIELKYLNWALDREQLVRFYGGCSLPPLLQVTLWTIGGVGGFLLGTVWWRKVYVERIWLNRRVKVK